MTDCIFCKIVAGEIPAEVIKETDNLIVFKDIHPKAPVHFLIIPKKHINDLRGASDAIWSEIKKVAEELAREKQIAGFRLSTNAGEAAAVSHLHVHFLGGIKADREI